MSQKPWIVPIPGTTKLHRLTENNGAASIELTEKELQEIEDASAHIKIMGTRYTEAMESQQGCDCKSFVCIIRKFLLFSTKALLSLIIHLSRLIPKRGNDLLKIEKVFYYYKRNSFVMISLFLYKLTDKC